MESIPLINRATNVNDSDPAETLEWLEALDSVLHSSSPARCGELISRLIEHARFRCIELKGLVNTPYRNTIAPQQQQTYPGDLTIERRITAIVRWNALAMVVRANRESTELGGHLASYASAADLFEVGFNHFFHGDESDAERRADFVFFQPHSSPGIYARAFLEGRLTENQLANFRREIGGNGLCSYAHPWLMPQFWQFPTGSMGIGPITAVYQARFMHYLENRTLLERSDRKVWAFVGDGEMDEPESIAGLSVAARENLDNLIFVINCNLQRLDGPVRGNGSIIQELERLFLATGWNVIKVLWGSDWDDLFARDQHNLILRRLHETVDGDLQTYGAHDAAFNRERFFNKSDDLRALVSDLSDEQIDKLTRGGHDPVKIYAAFKAATEHTGQPTAILALTKKGYGLGRWGESRMSAHQQKKLDKAALRCFRDRFELPLSDEDADNASFYKPAPDSPEITYLLDRRRGLGGFVPGRKTCSYRSLQAPSIASFAGFVFAPDSREFSSTSALVRMLSNLLRDGNLGRSLVPIVADEARTFGMESLFRTVGVYSHCGQTYEPVDKDQFLYYKESRDGQILEEGINEAGAVSSWIAAGTSYSNHGIAMVPFYIFYSMFGFQRVGDLIWAAADSRARGFLVGATSGRTTLSGEGLQHQDGMSHLTAAMIPTCRAYDPCFAYEIAFILREGLTRILDNHEDVFYYVTVTNENYVHAPMPVGVEEGIIRGMYLVRSNNLGEGTSSDFNCNGSVQLLGSGAVLREALAAAEILEQDWRITANVWSVTSFSELRRSGMETERWNRIHVDEECRLSWVEQCLNSTKGPIIAVSDYVRAVPDLIRAWVPRKYITLGTDGFGRSDTRSALRRFFEIDQFSIAFSALTALVQDGLIDKSAITLFRQRYDYAPSEFTPWNL